MSISNLLVVLLAVAGVVAIAPAEARGQVRLARLFSDHVVLQRESAVPVWGWAAPGEQVTVTFAGQTHAATADADGRWRVRLDPMPASHEGRELVARGASSSAVARDVLVGEVWLAGGQSNMRWPLFAAHDAAEVIPTADDPALRFFIATLRTGAEPLDDLEGSWKLTTPQDAREFYAVAFFAARELRRELDVPVGVIGVAWGGTPIQTWISLEELERDPPLEKPLAAWEAAVAQHRAVQADPSRVPAYEAELARWQREVEPKHREELKAWEAARARGEAVGEKPKPPTPEPSNPDPTGMPSPSRRPNTPTISFNGLIAPAAPFSIRGVWWYQGETNGSAGLEYRTLFRRLIADWRRHWDGDLPFLFVQLPSHGADPEPVASRGWPWVREAQLMALALPRTAMAVTIDVGDPADVHPAGKRDVGRRLALLALRDVYGRNIVASGPIYERMSVEGSAIRLHFRETGGGLTPGQSPWLAKGVEPFPADRLIGFFIAGEDRRWVEAEARIDGDSVVVSSESVPSPVAVRYGWANSPRCNLYNREGLPASPFRTDEW